MSKLSDEKIVEIANRQECNNGDHLQAFPFARAIEAAVLAEQAKQEPVAFGWRDVVEELPTEAQEVLFVRDNKVVHGAWIGGIFWHSNTKMAASKWMPLPPVELPLLYAAPVVQPDMVMVPREPTEAMLDAAMNRYQHVSPEAKARYTQMHRENFRCDYKAMIAAAEGKSNARLTVAEPVGRASDSTRKLDIGD